eukprot:13791155-Ditylum_brightwellii.AAC.1
MNTQRSNKEADYCVGWGEDFSCQQRSNKKAVLFWEKLCNKKDHLHNNISPQQRLSLLNFHKEAMKRLIVMFVVELTSLGNKEAAKKQCCLGRSFATKSKNL